MAQTIKEIQEIIKSKVAESEDLQPLDILTEDEQNQITSTSIVSEWGRFIWIFAFVAWLQQKLFDTHKADVNAILAAGRVHTKGWYRSKILDYQHGYDLIEDTDKYPEAVDQNEQILIDASKQIKQCAIIKRGNSLLRAKVATEVNGELAAVPQDVMDGLQQYIEEFEDAGTNVIATTGIPDDLKLEIDVHFNALIINSLGEVILEPGSTPVKDAINEYLKSIGFNGRLVVNDLEEYIKQVDGIEVVDIQGAYSKHGLHTYESTGVSNAGVIDQFRSAEAGYMKLDEAVSTFNYVPYDE